MSGVLFRKRSFLPVCASSPTNLCFVLKLCYLFNLFQLSLLCLSDPQMPSYFFSKARSLFHSFSNPPFFNAPLSLFPFISPVWFIFSAILSDITFSFIKTQHVLKWVLLNLLQIRDSAHECIQFAWSQSFFFSHLKKRVVHQSLHKILVNLWDLRFMKLYLIYVIKLLLEHLSV